MARTIVNDDIMIPLARSLAINTTIKELDLSDNDNVTATGWNAFLAIFENPTSSALEKLDLSFNSINDDAVYNLTSSLAGNSKLRELDISGAYNLTDAGCEYFSAVLQSPTTALERLQLRYNFMRGETMVSLADALANNSTLEELLVSSEDALDDTVSDGWAAFTRILCDKSSIMATYNSNHTLRQLICDEEFSEDDLPGDICSLLQINRKHDKIKAARIKIIKTHFTGGNCADIIEPFIGMETKVLPRAIAWALNDCHNEHADGSWGEGFDLAYQLISRSMVPILSGADGNSKKSKQRKRCLALLKHIDSMNEEEACDNYISHLANMM